MGVNGFMARPETGRPVTGRYATMIKGIGMDLAVFDNEVVFHFLAGSDGFA